MQLIYTQKKKSFDFCPTWKLLVAGHLPTRTTGVRMDNIPDV